MSEVDDDYEDEPLDGSAIGVEPIEPTMEEEQIEGKPQDDEVENG